MSSRSSGPAQRPVAVALCLMAVAFVMAIVFAANAKAAEYKMVLCAGNNGSNSYGTSTNTTSPQNPGGIFDFSNFCGPAPDPAGDHALLRISENQSGGYAGQGAYGNIYYDTPPAVHFRAAGGFTRQPFAFNDGWRARFWISGGSAGTRQILIQGTGLPNSGDQRPSSNTFGSHLWPLGGYLDFTRFAYELQCVRPGGCDRANANATDVNTLVFILSDESPSRVNLTDSGPLMAGLWVRGSQVPTYRWSEQGSGIRFERLRIDGAERFSIDHVAAKECNRDSSQANGEFARDFQACPTSDGIGRSYAFDTASLPDGGHTLSVCTQDYAQWQGLGGTGSESCDQRTIRVDNSAPGAPSGLRVTSANPQRYLDRFGAIFSLPPNSGSPITKVHYDIIDPGGKAVAPEKVLPGTNPTELANIEGPAKAGAYRLRVWLEDQVGLSGPAAVAEIPHDTTPPAAPQELSVTAPGTARSSQGSDVRWHNIPDAGSPIDAVHYRVLDGGGKVVVPITTVAGENPQTIGDLDTPRERGSYMLELWLSDGEGNTGAPVKAPLGYECVRSEDGGGTGLTAGLGEGADPALLVRQGEGSTLRGRLQGLLGSKSVPVCVFSRVVTDSEREFLGIAMTADGEYRFPLDAGPSRDLSAVYRPDQRELSAHALLRTRVRPSFELQSKVVRNKGFAIFKGAIPGPHSGKVVVVLQVKSGKAWRVFRRYRTREDGRYVMRYRFTKTTTPTVYVMRAQVRAQSGLPYEEGNSQARRLRVVPGRFVDSRRTRP